MDDLLQELGDVLDRERQAALGADVTCLEGLQEEKRALFDRVRDAGGLEGPRFRRLAEIARANVGLIRQLVLLHRALAGVDAQGAYGADGREQAPEGPRLTRGVL